MVNQILARNLHSNDADILNYTTMLMDKLEQVCTVVGPSPSPPCDTSAGPSEER